MFARNARMGKSGENEKKMEKIKEINKRKAQVGAQIKLGGKWNAVHSAHSHVYKQTNKHATRGE